MSHLSHFNYLASNPVLAILDRNKDVLFPKDSRSSTVYCRPVEEGLSSKQSGPEIYLCTLKQVHLQQEFVEHDNEIEERLVHVVGRDNEQ